jgi:hypothetical protein
MRPATSRYDITASSRPCKLLPPGTIYSILFHLHDWNCPFLGDEGGITRDKRRSVYLHEEALRSASSATRKKAPAARARGAADAPRPANWPLRRNLPIFADIAAFSESRAMRAKLARTRLNRPKTARFDATSWMNSGGSPMTLYRTICVRRQGPNSKWPPGSRSNGPHHYSKASFGRKKECWHSPAYQGHHPRTLAGIKGLPGRLGTASADWALCGS